MAPYRSTDPPGAIAGDDANPNAHLWPALGLVWLASAVRVVLALHLGEAFGAEATLALGAFLGLPGLAWAGVRRRA